VRDEIVKAAREKGYVRSGQVAEAFGISRQAAHAHLRALVRAGVLIREGQGRGARYRLPRARYRTAGLEEDRVWRDLREEVPEIAALESNAERVMRYAITEMVNNAIDHSAAEEVEIEVRAQGEWLSVEIADAGIGIFERVRSALGLESELEALQEISKGKMTTMPERHSGQGIFFTSKAVHRFEIESGGLRWIVDNDRSDHAIGPLDPRRRGTLVRLSLDPRRARELKSVFDEYTEEFEFTRTRAVVKLFAYGTSFVSRSEAKRLTAGLEKFSEVILDFTGVEMIGQGFADEVFRVWQRTHPNVTLSSANASEPVHFMIERARRAH
jgi:anti-sigma regulatory factor (Ser/Thr protein kinase)